MVIAFSSLTRLIFLVFLHLAYLSPNAQKVEHFKWEDDPQVFSSVEMKVTESASKKLIFSGYKDALIEIGGGTTSLGPTTSTVKLILSGYFKIEHGNVHSFECSINDLSGPYTMDLKYGITEGSKFAFLVIRYDIMAQEVISIYVSSSEDYKSKKAKDLTFQLKGFAPTKTDSSEDD